MGSDVQDRTYHGLPDTDEQGGQRIVVEEFGGGPTKRQRAEILYELENQRGYYGPHAFWWGYQGTNPHDTAIAILTDALGKRPTREMEHAFVEDVVAHLCTEWLMNRRMILRWARGWCIEHSVGPLSVSDALK